MQADRAHAFNASLLNGWTLTGVLSLAVALMAVGIAAAHQFDVEGMSAVIRATARSSLLFFCLAFSAAALHQLWPNGWTRWQRRNRRYLGVTFGVSHGVHAIAIVSLILVAPELVGSAASTDMLIFGGLGYAFIVAMVATSFDRTAAVLGPRAWRALHWTSVYFIWLSFVVTFGKRAGANPAYWSFIAILLAVMALRLLAWRRSSARTRASVAI
jgi:methionine sulfoxide reductase heme-binding subunit